MSNYHLYQEVLTSANRGTALWEPSSELLQVGDVGYLSFGTFIRLFNATLPIGHPNNQFGVPDGYRPIGEDFNQTRRTTRPPGIVSTGVHPVDSHDSSEMYTFQCTNSVGAVLLTEQQIISEDVLDAEVFRDYLLTHIQSWLAFARDLGRDVSSNQLIFLTGFDFTVGRYSATLFTNISSRKLFKKDTFFQIPRPGSINWQTCSHLTSMKDFRHNNGPWNPQSKEASCKSTLFVRGFRCLDKDCMPLQPDLGLRCISLDETDNYRTPLDAVLQYLTDSANARVAIAHDVNLFDLAQKEKVLYSYQYVLKALRKRRHPFHCTPVATLC